MKQCCLSEESLVHLGIYDDVYDLYYKLGQAYNTAYDGYYEVFPESSILWPNKFNELARRECRRSIDSFLQKHSFIFTNEYTRLYTNASSMMSFSMLTVTPPKPLSLRVITSIKTFHSFLYELYYLVSELVFLRMQRDNPSTSRDHVYSQVEQTVIESERKAVETGPSINRDDLVTTGVGLNIFQSLSLISCNLQNHTVIPKLYQVESIVNSSQILIPVHLCEICGRCFIGEKTLAIYEKIYGKLFVQIVRPNNTRLGNGFFSELNTESLLHSLGYNVVEGRLAEKERRDLLVYLLKSQKISYFQACRDLENAIRIFRDVETHQLAVKKWMADLKYISDYMKNRVTDIPAIVTFLS